MDKIELTNLTEKLKTIALKTGFWETGMIQIDTLHYNSVVRKICIEKCQYYGTSWACPPAVGTLEQCRKRCEQYDYMMLFSGKYEIEDFFNSAKLLESISWFKKMVERFDKKISNFLSSYILLSNEGCGVCQSCTWPDAPCRFPDKLYHSIEGYGFNINQLADYAKMRYNNGQNTITYFGALLFCN